MAINAYNNYVRNAGLLGKSIEKLSSGFRINRAGDDPAGLVISERLRSQIGGMKQATRNAQDAISMVQVAEGSLGEVHSMLQRVRDLTVQASNDSNDADSRQAIQDEIDQLGDQIDNIILGASFNQVSLFGSDGKGVELHFQIGPNATKYDVMTLGKQDLSSVVGGVRTAPGTGVTVDSHEHAKDSLKHVDAMIKRVSAVRGTLGASQNRLDHTINSLRVNIENTTAAEARIRDVDMAEEFMNFTRLQILQQATIAMMAQANQIPQGILQLLR